MDPATLSTSYVEHVARLERRLDTDDALRRAVGGEFMAVGKLEYHLLRSRGLRDDHLVVDVGCGSGRLACQLAPFPGIRYVGCDVVPRLLDYARELCGRADWRFEPTNGTTIPCASDTGDFACFFSVFTHLSQEDIFRYFREAHRVLKTGGLMVMSFLEFRVPTHWGIFMASVNGTRDDEHLNQFVEREALHAWAAAAGFEVRSIHAGNTEYIPLPEEIRFENGSRMNRMGSLGQSVAVLQKRVAFATPAVTPAAPVAASVSPADPKPEASAAGAVVAPLRNASTRVALAPGQSSMLGFTLAGAAQQRVLVRAIGPTLSAFGVSTPLAQPSLTVFAGPTQVAQNSGWAGDAAVAEAAVIVGAFTLAPNSRDAAVVLTLAPGGYSAVVSGTTSTDQGEVLIEVYIVT